MPHRSRVKATSFTKGIRLQLPGFLKVKLALISIFWFHQEFFPQSSYFTPFLLRILPKGVLMKQLVGKKHLENGYIITWILHQIFMFSNKWNSVLKQRFALQPSLPFPSFLLDERTDKKSVMTTIFPCHNIQVYSTSII